MARKISLSTVTKAASKAVTKATKVRPLKAKATKAKAPAKAPKAPAKATPVQVADPSNHLNTAFQSSVLDALRKAKALKAPATAKALAALSVSFGDFLAAGGPKGVLGYAHSFQLANGKLSFTPFGARRYRDLLFRIRWRLFDVYFKTGLYDRVTRFTNAVRFLFRIPLQCDCDGMSDHDVTQYRMRGIRVDADQPHHPCCSAYTTFTCFVDAPANDDPSWLDYPRQKPF